MFLKSTASLIAGAALAMLPGTHSFIAPRRDPRYVKDSGTGAGAARARARLAAERAATAERLKDAPPPKVTRQQLRAEARKAGQSDWRGWHGIA